MVPQASIKEDLRRSRTELQELREEASAIVIEARAVLQQEIALARTEIGEATGVGRETVKSRLRYALAKLREELRDVL